MFVENFLYIGVSAVFVAMSVAVDLKKDFYTYLGIYGQFLYQILKA
jgi:hypothetical protein